MTVQEAIDKLSQYPPQTYLCHEMADGGIADVVEIREAIPAGETREILGEHIILIS